MNKIYWGIEIVSVGIIILAVITFLNDGNFEVQMGRNFIDFMALLTFGLLGTEIFERLRNEAK